MNRYLLTIIFSVMVFPVFSNAQGWKWGHGISSSPFVVTTESWLLNADTAGNVYTASTVTPYSTLLAGVSLYWGSHSIVDSTAGYQAIITKTNTAGTCQWIIGTQHTWAYITDMASDGKGNLYILGTYDSVHCTFGNYPLVNPDSTVFPHLMNFIAKVDPAGNVLWAENIALSGYTTECYGGIGVDNVGNVYVSSIFVGTTATIGTTTLTNTSTIGFGSDLYIAKYDSSGNSLWAKKYGTDQWDLITSAKIAKTGEIYIAGFYNAPSISFGATTLTNTSGIGNFIVKFDNNGNPLWASSPDTFASINYISLDTGGNVYLTGTFYNDTLRFGSLAIVNSSPGQSDAFIAKYNTTGSASWAKDIGGSASDNGFCVAADRCGNVWMTGNMGLGFSVPGGYVVHFGNDSLVAPSNSSFFNDPLFMAHYDYSGNYIDGLMIPSGGDDVANIAVDNRGNFYVSGDWVAGTFSFGQNVIGIDSSEEFLFVAKYQYDTIGCIHTDTTTTSVQKNTGISADILLYPNPAYGECNIQSNIMFPPGSKAEVYDLTGRFMAFYNLSGYNTLIYFSGFSPGLYECKIYAGESIITKRLVVMK